MTKQNKNRKEQATLEQMVGSGSQIVMMREDGLEQPIEEIIESKPGLCDYPFDKDFYGQSQISIKLQLVYHRLELFFGVYVPVGQTSEQ